MPPAVSVEGVAKSDWATPGILRSRQLLCTKGNPAPAMHPDLAGSYESIRRTVLPIPGQ
ncbi:hypothetical protein D1872_343650 [compost metagenome]